MSRRRSQRREDGAWEGGEVARGGKTELEEGEEEKEPDEKEAREGGEDPDEKKEPGVKHGV